VGMRAAGQTIERVSLEDVAEAAVRGQAGGAHGVFLRHPEEGPDSDVLVEIRPLDDQTGRGSQKDEEVRDGRARSFDQACRDLRCEARHSLARKER
jgi:hypothetical protein